MSEEDALLQAILFSPRDDAPRFIYADWLEETRQSANVARAELIRVQIALERLPETAPEWPELVNREEKLLRRYWKTWQQPFHPGQREQVRRITDGVGVIVKVFQRSAYFRLSRWWFSRGFIEEVRGCFGPDSAYELEAGFPLRRVTLFADDCQFLPALRHDPRLDQLEWFHICSLWPFGGGTLRSDDDVIIAAPMNLIVSATLQGLIVVELRLPWMPLGRMDRIHRVIWPPSRLRRRQFSPEKLDQLSDRLYRTTRWVELAPRTRGDYAKRNHCANPEENPLHT
jgi:uncharacterized protein (TIGR02996 family)